MNPFGIPEGFHNYRLHQARLFSAIPMALASWHELQLPFLRFVPGDSLCSLMCRADHLRGFLPPLLEHNKKLEIRISYANKQFKC